MNNIIHIGSAKPIDCADQIGDVIAATLGGDFTLHEDGSFTLDPWAGGLTEVGQSFADFVRGRRFATLLSVLAIIMDSHVEIASRPAPRAWIHHIETAAVVLKDALGRGPHRPCGRFKADVIRHAWPLIPYCVKQMKEGGGDCVILNRNYHPVGVEGGPPAPDESAFRSAIIEECDPALSPALELLQSRPDGVFHYFFKDSTCPINRGRAERLLAILERIVAEFYASSDKRSVAMPGAECFK